MLATMIVDTTYVVDTIYVVSVQISVPFCPSMLTQEGDQKMYYTTFPYWGIVMLGDCNGKRQDFRLHGRMPIILSGHIPYWWLWSTPKNNKTFPKNAEAIYHATRTWRTCWWARLVATLLKTALFAVFSRKWHVRSDNWRMLKPEGIPLRRIMAILMIAWCMHVLCRKVAKWRSAPRLI